MTNNNDVGIRAKHLGGVFDGLSLMGGGIFQSLFHRNNLGAKVISVENALENSSAHKGESIEDTTKMLCSYADIIVIRHPEAGSLKRAAKGAAKPLINAGDGANEHPTQGFLD